MLAQPPWASDQAAHFTLEAALPEIADNFRDIRDVHEPIRWVRRDVVSYRCRRHSLAKVVHESGDVADIGVTIVVGIRWPSVRAAGGRGIRTYCELGRIKEPISIRIQAL